jgi:glycosyltransferase involved in cell wall biosynthesis
MKVPALPPLRILFAVDSLDVGGAERHAVDLARALVRRGHAVTIACSRAGPLEHVATQAGVQVRELVGELVKRRVSLRYAWRLAELIRSGRYDLVHAHIYASTVAAMAATALRGGPPLVVTEHSDAAWRSPLAKAVHRSALRRVARVIAVSDTIRDRLIEEGVPRDRVVVIRNAVTDHGAPRADPFLRDGVPLIGTVARLKPEKGVRYFIEAAARLAARCPEARFVVIGDGPERDELERRAAELGVPVWFLGARGDVPEFVGFLDVLVLPSLSEGTPLVTLEAMSAGVPVVATNVGGIPYQITDGREGFLVPPADPVAIADALVTLVEDRDLRREMGERARARIEAGCRHDELVRAVVEVYRAALAEKEHGSADRRGVASHRPAWPAL